MSAAFPPCSLGAPSSRLLARRENSAAALRSLAGFAGASRLIARRENSAAALRELRTAPPSAVVTSAPDVTVSSLVRPVITAW